MKNKNFHGKILFYTISKLLTLFKNKPLMSPRLTRSRRIIYFEKYKSSLIFEYGYNVEIKTDVQLSF